MSLIAYWILLPALIGAITGGLGLLVRAYARDLRAELVFPVGVAATIVVASVLTYFPWTTVLAGPALVVGALAGWVLAIRSGFSPRAVLGEHLHWVLGSLFAFVVFGASVFLSGKPTFTGYTQIVDIGHQFEIASWVAQHGRELPVETPISSSQAVVAKTLGVGYPSGSQAVLGALARLFRFEIAWGYQPLLAIIAASIVPVLSFLLRPAIDNRWFRTIGAFTAAQASILIGYAQIGGVKELTAALLIALTAALAVRLTEPTDDRGTRQVFPIALAAAAAFAVLSLTLLPWLGLVAIATLVVGARRLGLGRVAGRGAIAVGLFVVLAAPTLVQATHTGGAVSTVQNNADIGNLSEPVGHIAATGIWLSHDYRFPIAGTALTATNVIGVIVVVLALIGLGVAWKRKAEGLVILGIAGAGGLAVVIYVFSPWIELKAMAITAPITLTLAVAGLSAVLTVRRLAFLGWIGLLGLLVTGLTADGMRYRYAVLAPHDRLSELQDIGAEFAGQGPTLHPDFEEQAEYALRDVDAVASVNSSPKFGFLLTEAAAKARPGVQFTWDLDEFEPQYIQNYRLIVLRRAPLQSRPPGNYRQVKAGKYYVVWERDDTPAPAKHLPLSGTPLPADRGVCRANRRDARLGDATSFTVAPSADYLTTLFDPAKQSPNLPLNPDRNAMTINGPGKAYGQVEVPRTGRYEVYFATNAYRSTKVTVDNREIADFSDNPYVPRPDYLATVELTAGSHPVELTRGGGGLAPGSTDTPGGHALGPVLFVPAGQLNPAPKTTPPADADCTGALTDWVETR